MQETLQTAKTKCELKLTEERVDKKKTILSLKTKPSLAFSMLVLFVFLKNSNEITTLAVIKSGELFHTVFHIQTFKKKMKILLKF